MAAVLTTPPHLGARQVKRLVGSPAGAPCGDEKACCQGVKGNLGVKHCISNIPECKRRGWRSTFCNH